MVDTRMFAATGSQLIRLFVTNINQRLLSNSREKTKIQTFFFGHDENSNLSKVIIGKADMFG